MSGSRATALVTGAGIAGPAAAYWLSRIGFEVTVVERSPGPRAGGQNIDVRGSAREVLRLMELEDEVRARGTGETGTAFVRPDGTAVAEFPVDPGTGDGPTAELEILRGALAEVLVDACPPDVEWRWGDHVVACEEDDSGVQLDFETGARERYDVMVVAEGVQSSTRSLVMGDEPRLDALGMYNAFGTIARTDADDDRWRFLVVEGSRQASLRPDDTGTTRAMLNFLADDPVLDGLDGAAVRRALRDRFADVGWEVPRILDGFDASDDLYVDWLTQVRCPRWHRGRVVLLGDAAWCVTPIGGGGTSLAITGAYVLAAMLSHAPDDHVHAFSQFEEWMRPLVTDAQDLPPGVPRLAAPGSWLGVRALRMGLRAAALPVVRSVATRLTAGPSSEEGLPALDEPLSD